MPRRPWQGRRANTSRLDTTPQMNATQSSAESIITERPMPPTSERDTSVATNLKPENSGRPKSNSAAATGAVHRWTIGCGRLIWEPIRRISRRANAPGKCDGGDGCRPPPIPLARVADCARGARRRRLVLADLRATKPLRRQSRPMGDPVAASYSSARQNRLIRKIRTIRFSGPSRHSPRAIRRRLLSWPRPGLHRTRNGLRRYIEC